MLGKELLVRLDSDVAGEIFSRLYGSEGVEPGRERYASLIEEYMRDSPDWFPRKEFPESGGDIRVFSAPGRTELGGNHTDHNQGKVLAASIQLDAVAVVSPRSDKRVFYRSTGHEDVAVDLGDLTPRPDEKGKAGALIRGIAAEFAKRGRAIGGFSANADSRVLPGSGLSSSASLEVLIGRIFDCLYGDGKMGALEIAQIGQKAENVFFGKPCGLMDQTACASGGAVAIDFGDAALPQVNQIDFNPAITGTSLCVVDTRGSHSDLTADYAAIPAEMRAAAAVFGKSVLRELDRGTVLANAAKIREKAGDRALLRALHFLNENERVDAMFSALTQMNKALHIEDKQRAFGIFLDLVNASGDSSWELLQNIYPPSDPARQGVSVALALTRNFLRGSRNKGACRVHGGGFAGTIQAYIPQEGMSEYKKEMEDVFGAGSVTVISIRPAGVVELEF